MDRYTPFLPNHYDDVEPIQLLIRLFVYVYLHVMGPCITWEHDTVSFVVVVAMSHLAPTAMSAMQSWAWENWAIFFFYAIEIMSWDGPSFGERDEVGEEDSLLVMKLRYWHLWRVGSFFLRYLVIKTLFVVEFVWRIIVMWVSAEN